ncbi:hypothetical protein E3T24_02490 [Cryobacterium sp. TmT2-59]|uniref:hypothetical protein n=1 Tax=Cryobacterium sp. TmT2-59 TaxID=1259264 RepID=UPI00106B2A98|nr:hypothetical protein [Cryobacterium sp. TmT2-59]TFC88738.1 hypothetical protein E3T24_02490 [Cryobacterium sp. TmT2-59]
MTTLSSVLIALFVIILVSFIVTFVVVRMLYKRLRPSRMLTGAVLRSQARVVRGPQREVLKLRVRLQDTLDSGQAAVDLARSSEGPLGELPRLFRRVRSEGATLESQLRLLQSESDPAVLAEAIPVARRRVDQVAVLARRLRSAVASGLGDLTDDSLMTLHSDVDHEVDALRAGVQELRTLNGHDAFPSPPVLEAMHRVSTNRLTGGNGS